MNMVVDRNFGLTGVLPNLYISSFLAEKYLAFQHGIFKEAKVLFTFTVWKFQ